MTGDTSWQNSCHEEPGGSEFGPVEFLTGPSKGNAGRAGPEVGKRGQRHEREKVRGSSKRFLRLGCGPPFDLFGRLHEQRQDTGQRTDKLGKVGVSGIIYDEFRDGLGEVWQELLLQYLPPKKIKGLDSIGAFVNLGDANIADKLLLAVAPNKPMAAQDLHTKVGNLTSAVGQE